MLATRPVRHRELLLGLALLAGVNAIGGAFAPSRIVLVAVGGGMLLAAGLQLARARQAPEVSIAAGATLAGWIVAQVLVIPFSRSHSGSGERSPGWAGASGGR